MGELVGGPSAHGSPKGKVKGKAKGEATEPEVKIEGGRRGKKNSFAQSELARVAGYRPRRSTPCSFLARCWGTRHG